MKQLVICVGKAKSRIGKVASDSSRSWKKFILAQAVAQKMYARTVILDRANRTTNAGTVGGSSC
jgi:hypothetical protein